MSRLNRIRRNSFGYHRLNLNSIQFHSSAACLCVEVSSENIKSLSASPRNTSEMSLLRSLSLELD